MKTYYKRIIDQLLNDKLSYSGAVYLRGPKWCGKSTTAKQICKSHIDLGDSGDGSDLIGLAELSPQTLLRGETPRLIDEWQLAPKLWNAVKTEIDRRDTVGQFILTGSATPTDDETRHPGTGRIARINMYPMSLYESMDSTGEISLMDLLNHEDLVIDGIESALSIEDYAFLICRGGWPSTLSLKKEYAIKVASDYLDALSDDDLSRTAKLPNNPRLIRYLLKSYARNVSTIDTYKTIYMDVKSQYGDISDTTLKNYLIALERLYIVDEIEAWNPNLRSQTVIRSAKKKHMIDPSLAAASLGASPDSLLLDLRTLGLLFESLVNRDLRIYVDAIGGDLNHYRDQYGLECDAVLHFDHGKFMLVEIKMGSSHIDHAAHNLLRLKQLIVEKHMTAPSALVVITAGKRAYKRPDGIYVIPIGCLKP